MASTTLHIKNMVCPRCVRAVTEVLRQQGADVEQVVLGEAVVRGELPDLHALGTSLQEIGFELIFDKERQMVAQIKAALIEYLTLLQTADLPLTTSAFLAEKLNQPYQNLSKLFSRSEHTTIEKYLIRLKIERVKELLSYQELTLSEIAYQLKYSSVQHLSNQFKNVTGVSVSDYKNNPQADRTPLNEVS